MPTKKINRPRTVRLGDLLIARGIVATPRQAEALVLAAAVRVDGAAVTQVGAEVPEDAALTVLAAKKFPSRGGEKLAFALDRFAITVDGKVCLDVGAATGGFTSCLLQRGAGFVHALDVARGALAWELRNDPRVRVWEGVNAKHFDGRQLRPPPSFLTMDVSFVSAAVVLRELVPTLPVLTEAVVLVKPQFEARREEVERGGVVRDRAVRRRVVKEVAAALGELGFTVAGVIPSRPRGPAGNREYFIYAHITAP